MFFSAHTVQHAQQHIDIDRFDQMMREAGGQRSVTVLRAAVGS